MGNKNSKPSVDPTLSTQVKYELVFCGYIRTRTGRRKELSNIHLPDVIIELCYQYYAKDMYFNLFDRLVSNVDSNEIIHDLTEILTKINEKGLVDNDSVLAVNDHDSYFLQAVGFVDLTFHRANTTKRCLEAALRVQVGGRAYARQATDCK